MAIQVIGNGGTILEVDANRNMPTIEGERGYTAGGEYIVTGGGGTVAAALAASTMLMSMRMSTGSTRKAYITRARIVMSTITAGAAAGVPSVIGLQRFTAQTPTGGTARTVDKKTASHPSNSDMTDVRDSNAALTGTAPTFGNVIAQNFTPTNGTAVYQFEWVFEPDAEPVVLAAGDGLAIRTQTVGPATATWSYLYTFHWYEK
jgi:hypothetical protein